MDAFFFYSTTVYNWKPNLCPHYQAALSSHTNNDAALLPFVVLCFSKLTDAITTQCHYTTIRPFYLRYIEWRAQALVVGANNAAYTQLHINYSVIKQNRDTLLFVCRAVERKHHALYAT